MITTFRPVRGALALTAILALTACGGGRGAVGGGRYDAPVRAFATGPVYTACLRANRTAASRDLCGCVQASADTKLSRGEQSRAAKFFSDPHQAQVTRQSDRARDERYWTRYKQFVAIAERTCA
ncbi:hypothetical protein JSE7799_02839 [Jannaschia seosinensis]|uniref:Arginine transporter n=1 Tax=Jannaschia seosinensis TaxID=313367 RepID=A0A0M7BBK0_9RHOB|nr:hypothetical protein [Jannaschia seosinensis]CUH40110.1 hypothetical protein JSE7799_02839 [Jannaschia seosinensis]